MVVRPTLRIRRGASPTGTHNPKERTPMLGSNFTLTPPPVIPVRRLDHEAVLPEQARQGDAGYDLYALEEYDLGPGDRELFRTGIALAIPEGYVGYIKPRSGLAARQGIDVLGGVIDSGYRGEINVLLLNTDASSWFTVRPGDRIAQLVIQPVANPAWHEVYELPESERGTGGFGSTGTGAL